MNKPTKTWSTLEYTLMALAAVLLCAAAGLTAVILGGFFDGDQTALPSTATPAVSLPGSSTSIEAQSVSLSPTTGAPGATVKVQGQGWPSGSRIVISLVPANPPAYTVNSAVVNDAGQFSVEIIVPSDPRWLNESPVPVMAQLDDGSRSAQAMLTIMSPGGDRPAVTPPVIEATVPTQPTATPTPPAATAAQLTVNAHALNVRTGPGVNYAILGVLLNGQKAEVTGRNADGTWWQIRFPSGDGRGWVSAAYATAENIGNVPIVNAPAPPPPPPPTPTAVPDIIITEWRGEYFTNPNLQGPPVLVRNDSVVSFDWGLGSPASQIPVDNFSARWTRTIGFPAGVYRFYARADDGVRLWVDNSLVIDQWNDQAPTTFNADIYLDNGPHTLRMEYYERAMGAIAMLSWERVDQYPDWKAEYFNGTGLQGSPLLVRNEPSINYNWTNLSPAPGTVPTENFSVRWMRRVSFDSGDYVFRIRADDGMRVWVDNNLIFDRWQDGDSGWQEQTRNIPGGVRDIRVEYYQRTGQAFITTNWQRVDHPDKPPIAVISAPSEGLIKQPVKFDGSRSRRGDNDIDKYRWDFGDGATAEGKEVSHTYNSTNSYNVKLTVIDRKGLENKTSVTIKINQDLTTTTPPIAEISGPTQAKVGELLTFDGTRSQSLSPIVRYDWDFGDGVTASGQKVNHNYPAAGTYRVRLTVYAQNGLVSSDNVQTVISTIVTPPVLEAKISAPGVAETHQPVTFDGSQSTATHAIASAEWSFGDGNSALGWPTISHTYPSAGTYDVTLTLTDAQSNHSSTKQRLTITDPLPAVPVPDIEVSTLHPLAGQSVSFDGSNSKPATLADSAFAWDFGDGATAAGKQTTHVYPTAGSYTVHLTLTDTANQTATASVNMDVQPLQPPQAVIDAQPNPVTAGEAVTFDADNSQAAAPITGVDWDFGDGDTGSGSPIDHVYAQAGQYSVTLTLTDQNGLQGSATEAVQVDPAVLNPPQAVISPVAPVEVGQPVTLDGSASVPGDNPIAAYAWNLGDGTTTDVGPTIQYTYAQPGVYDVTLTVTDTQDLTDNAGLQVQITDAAPVVTPPQADITAPTEANLDELVTFDSSGSDNGSGQSVSHVWDFGDGDTADGLVVSHIYGSPGDYNVSLTVTTENGSDTTTAVITIIDPNQGVITPTVQPPLAVISGPAQGPAGSLLPYDASASQADNLIISYLWNFGDGSSHSNGFAAAHSYPVPGTYTVSLTIGNQAGEQAINVVTVSITSTQLAVITPPQIIPPAPLLPGEPPVAVIAGPAEGLTGPPVQFDASYSLSNSPIVSYTWDFGDGGATYSSGMASAHSFIQTGTYTISLILTDQTGLTGSTTLPVLITP
jgi:PKD repeat protein